MSQKNLKRIPATTIPISKEEATLQASLNLKKIQQSSEFQGHAEDFLRELHSGLPQKAKMNRLKKAADKISATITPLSACRNGCSHCCNIAATITKTEAEAMARASGRKMEKLNCPPPSEDSRMKWFRVPCPFLVNGSCSVYEERPIVCRLMFNIADSNYFCSTDIEPEDSHVTMLNLQQLETGYMKSFILQQWGDIRDFFPGK